MQHMLPGPAV